MYSFRRLAILLALASSAIPVLSAQSSGSSSSSNPALTEAPAAASDQAQAPAAGQTPAQAPSQAQPLSPSQLSVQARIRARREQRRAAALHETYDHLYELYVGAGYLRFTPGTGIAGQRVNEYDWNVGFTRYFNERLGATVDGRGYYGTPFINNNPTGITKPAISQYAALIGPTYRFYLQPKYSISGRVMAGFAQGNFYGDANGFGPAQLSLYPDGSTFGVEATVFVEYNIAPNLGFRVAPEYYATGFGSTIQNSLGYNIGLVVRFGKQ
jgi:hypothetical protein